MLNLRILAAIVIAAMGSAHAQIMYSANFNDATAPGFSNAKFSASPDGSRRVLGRYGNEAATLALSGLVPGRRYRVGVDVYAFDSWDGNSTGPGPDRFSISVSGRSTWTTTFSAGFGYTQAFPGEWGFGENPAGTGGIACNCNWRCWGIGPTIYPVVYDFVAVNQSETISFFGSGLEDLCNESWGIDNLVVTDFGSDPVADRCSSSPLLDLSNRASLTVRGTTVAATIDPVAPACPGIVGNGPSAWYTVIGTGRPITVSTCEYADFDTQLAVYCGDCGSLNCIVANDDGCPGGGSRVTFCSRAGSAYRIRVFGWEGAVGQFDLRVSQSTASCSDSVACLPCTITIPASAIPENEPACGPNYLDSFNAGCSSSPPRFSVITPGQTISGASGTFVLNGQDFRDTDWYEFTLAAPMQVTWSGAAEFPLHLGLIDGRNGCVTPITFLADAKGVRCAMVSASSILQPGRYWAWAAPEALAGVACGARYYASLAATPVGACSIGSGCVQVTAVECASRGGAYQGNATTCSQIGYADSVAAYAFEDISASGTVVAVTDDGGVADVDIGFSFGFYDSVYSRVGISPNGYLSFTDRLDVPRSTVIPSTTPPNNLIAPRWCNLNPPPNSVRRQTIGTAPERRFIVQWSNVPMFGFTDSNTFQVALFESTGEIQFRYQTVSTPRYDGEVRAGIENASGSRGTAILPSRVASNSTIRFARSTLTAPVAVVGGPYTFSATATTITADARGSYDPDSPTSGLAGIRTIQWDLGADGVADDAGRTNALQPITLAAFIAKGLSVSQNVALRLYVGDADGLQGSDQTLVSYANTSPVADAGGPYGPVVPGATVELQGGFLDPDLAMGVGETMAMEWDTRPATTASEIGDGFATTATPTVTFAQLRAWHASGLRTLYFNVADRRGAVSSAAASFSLALPDLQFAAAPTAPASARYGDTIRVQWSATNGGPGEATGPWNDRVYLSDNATLEPNVDRLLLTVAGPATVGPGAGYERAVDVTLPVDFAASGVRYLLVRLDDGTIVDELTEANNAAASTINVSPTLAADLAVTEVTSPVTAAFGGTISLAWTVANQGELAAVGAWSDSVVLSINSDFGDADDIALAPSIPGATPLPVGGLYQRSGVTFSIPPRYSPQATYRVLVRTGDPANVSPREANRANNVGVGPEIVMTPTPSPNLRVTEVVAPSTAVAGAGAMLRWTVSNAGTAPASGLWTDRVLLRDPAGRSPDVELGIFGKSATVAPDQSYTQQFAVTLPREIEGGRVFVVTTDSGNAIAEPAPGAEADNAAVSSPVTSVALPQGPDLVVTAVQPLGGSGTFGAPVSVQLTVRNQGTMAAAGAWFDRVLLRRDGANAAADLPLEPLSPAPAGPLAAGAEYTVTAVVTPPVRNEFANGAYRFVARADANGNLVEQREGNNEAVSAPFTLVRPVLPNLRVNFVSAPAPALPGAPVTVTWTVVNAGGARVQGAWAERLFVSSDAAIGEDTLLSTISIEETLEPGQVSSPRSRTVPAPSAGLSYRMVVCTDLGGAVVEESESDNCAVSIADSSIQRSDLTVRDVAAVPLNVMADDLITVSWTGENVGAAVTSGVFVDVVTLVDVVTGARHVLGSRVQGTPMQPGVPEQRVETFDVPGRIDGEFRVEVSADVANAIVEVNESNNTATGAFEVSVTQPLRPNLVVSAVQPPASGVVGSTQTVAFTVTNTASVGATGTWLDRVVARNVATGVEQELAIVPRATSLAAGASYSQSVTVRLPQTAGDYLLCVTTDSGDAVNEGLAGGEADNRRCAEAVFRAQTYIVTAVPSITEGVAGTPVTVTGVARATSGGDPIPNLPVALSVNVRGTVRTYADSTTMRTDAAGAYSLVLPLLPSEAGQYALRAGPPGNINPAVQGSFVLHGLRSTPSLTLPRIAPGAVPEVQPITVTNTGDLPLTGLAMSVAEAPPGLEIAGGPSSSPLLGQESRTFNVAFSAGSQAAAASGRVRLAFATSQGAVAETSFNAEIAPLAPQVAVVGATPVRSNMLVHREGESPIQTNVEVRLVNRGGSPTGPIAVQLPAASWLGLATPSTMASLSPGEEAVVVLTLTPGRNLLNADPRYPGTFQLRYQALTLSVPFEFTAVATATSSLIVRTEDESTFYKETPPDPFPPVRGAFVRVVRPDGNIVMASGLTDENGEARFDDLPEGDYYVEASADRHQPWRELVPIRGSQPVRVYPFLSFNAISYSWNVDPIQIEDRYRFTLEAIFETNVPFPVVDIEPRVIDLDNYADGQPHQINFMLTNRGLIRAQQVQLTVGDSADWIITTLNGEIGNLSPGRTVTVPAIIQRRPPACPTCTVGAGCSPPVTRVRNVVQCRGEQVLEQAVAYRLQPCGSPTGMGGGGGGVAAGGGNPPIVRSPSSVPAVQVLCCSTIAKIIKQSGFGAGDITGKVLDGMIGSRIDLMVGVQQECVRGVQWTIAGDVIDNYVIVSPTSGRVVTWDRKNLTQFDPAPFVWASPGSYQVSVVVTFVDGTIGGASAEFRIQAPSASERTAVVGRATLSPSTCQTRALNFGDPTPSTGFGPGFYATSRWMSLQGGEVQWLQLVTGGCMTAQFAGGYKQLLRQRRVDCGRHCPWYTPSGWASSPIFGVAMDDTPGWDICGILDPTWLPLQAMGRTQQFSTWLMYRPDDGIFVPWWKVEWSFDIRAEDRDGRWKIVRDVHSSTAPADAFGDFPEWNFSASEQWNSYPGQSGGGC